MADLRVPSAQHLARNWHDEVRQIATELVKLALNPPRFNYNPLYGAIRDLLVLGVPYEQVVAGIKKISRERVRNILLEVLPLIQDHFAGVSPDFYQLVERRYYPVGRGLMVPFEPPMIYGVSGQLYFPWFSFWRHNPLAQERLSLFVTLVDEILLQDPDLENARFEILDFSSPKRGHRRVLRIIDARSVARVADARKAQMLDVFAEGYFQAVTELATISRGDAKRHEERPKPDPDQPGFFDEL